MAPFSALVTPLAVLAATAPPPHAEPPSAAATPSAPVTAPAPAVSSRALGSPVDGRLAGGVQLPADGRSYFTWNAWHRFSPNPGWRRWATARTVERIVRVLDGFRAAHPNAPRIGVGDLSRRRGGDFGPRIAGGLGHASHQNGLDADIYFPRKDGLEVAAYRLSQVDRRLSQELVDRFVRAGARFVFVGPRVRLRGPRRVVQVVAHHDDHLHVRFAP